jgi:hypothetical protein
VTTQGEHQGGLAGADGSTDADGERTLGVVAVDARSARSERAGVGDGVVAVGLEAARETGKTTREVRGSTGGAVRRNGETKV